VSVQEQRGEGRLVRQLLTRGTELRVENRKEGELVCSGWAGRSFYQAWAIISVLASYDFAGL